ncbi:Arc family DNA-binding protein [Pantoea ananatis]|uniref:Arc family DNA-binding protein n=1 Tax=Pantoea ananas TaxID=553 RepID=UPI001B30A3AC|nr:Arc family DNA-binding protein [Pantoea ananatis]
MKGASLIAPLGVRIPDELKEKIQAQAKAHGRSMNAEIVHILEESLSGVNSQSSRNYEKEIESLNVEIQTLNEYINLQKRYYELAEEQISLLKAHIKSSTGFDVQEYFDKVIAEKNKKPT